MSHPSRSSGLFFSSSPAALDALLPLGSYSGKRDTDSVAHKLPTGLDCIKVTASSPETLRVKIGKERGKMDRWILGFQQSGFHNFLFSARFLTSFHNGLFVLLGLLLKGFL